MSIGRLEARSVIERPRMRAFILVFIVDVECLYSPAHGQIGIAIESFELLRSCQPEVAGGRGVLKRPLLPRLFPLLFKFDFKI